MNNRFGKGEASLLVLIISFFLYQPVNAEIRPRRVQAPVLRQSPGITPISSDYSVGRIPFTESMSPTGGVIITVPVMTAPLHGAPEVALMYNSQSGPGVAGYGWNVVGASSVSLAGKSIHYDGVASSPDTTLNSLNAVFALDGVRLVANDNNNMSSYEWVTAQGFIYVKRTSSGGANFEVVSPDGTRATYSTRSSTAPIASWITTKTDSDGYVTSYTYLDDAGTMYLTEIRYGGQTAASFKGRIVFTYDTRTDGVERWSVGKKATLGKVLTRIQSYNGTDLLRQYDLIQTTVGRSLRLTSLACHNAIGDSLPPLQFSYGPAESGTETLSASTSQMTSYLSKSTSGCLTYARGKMLPNQYQDALVVYNDSDNSSTAIYVYASFGEEVSPAVIQKGNGFRNVFTVDTDGDFVDELVRVNQGVVSSSATALTFSSFLLNSTGTELMSSGTYETAIPNVLTSNGYITPLYRIWPGDYDGDGRTEFLIGTAVYASSPSNYRLVKMTGSGNNSTTTITGSFNLTYNNIGTACVMDLNGDGRTEFCIADATGLRMYQVNATSMTLIGTISTLTEEMMAKVGFCDLNGDGLTDFVHHRNTTNMTEDHVVWYPSTCPSCGVSNPLTDISSSVNCRSCGINIPDYYWAHPGTAVCCDCGATLNSFLACPVHGSYVFVNGPNALFEWDVYINKGTGFQSYTAQGWPTGGLGSIQWADLNGDGLSDLVSLEGMNLYVYLNTQGSISSNSCGGVSVPFASDLVPLNVVYPKLYSSLVAVGESTIRSVCLNRDETGENILTGLVDSYANRYSFDYEDLQEYEGYSAGSGGGYPDVHVRFPLKLLSKKRLFENGGKTGEWSYTHTGATLNREGLGFRGFTQTVTTDDVREQSVIETRDPSKAGVITQISSEVSIITMDWSCPVKSNGEQNPRVRSRQEQNLLTGITEITNYHAYDTYNQPLAWTTNWGGPEYEVITVSYTNVISSTRYQIGLPYTTIKQRSRSSQMWKDKTIYNYDTKGHPTHRWSYTGTSGNQKTEETVWTYDSFGNVLSERSRPYSSTTYTGKNYTYSSDGTTLSSETDALGRTTTYSSYNRYGYPTSVTDYLGKTTTVAYDEWGSRTGCTKATGETSSISANWGGHGLYILSQSSNSTPSKKVHYDSADREIRTEVQRFDGQWQKTDRRYDELGRLERVSLSFRGDSASLWNVMQYDEYDRPVQEAKASGETTTWVYDGLSTTETRHGIASTKTLDETGRLISVSDSGGTVNYAYRVDGQPVTITAPGNVVTSFTYDEYGRRRSIIDPSAGVQRDSVSYNSDGSYVHKHKNPNGSINTSVDRFGRVTSVARISNATTGISYTYDTQGRLIRVSTGNTVHTYSYDSYGRILSEGETDGELELTRTYGYDSTGKLISTRYESSLGMDVTEQYGYAYGTHFETKLPNGTVIWKLQQEDDLGHATSALTGGVVRTYGFSPSGMPTFRKMNNGLLQNFSYSFDAQTGNLLSRTDLLNGMTESFGYDGLNRLTSMTVENITRSMNYALNGNITSMPGIGTMYYESNDHPYQLTSIAPSDPNATPPSDQTITYSAYHRPLTIAQDGRTASFVYNENDDRSRMTVVRNDTTLLIRHYLGDCYEVDEKVGETDQRLYLGGDYYDAPMVYVKEGNGGWTLYNIGRDYLGSVTHVATSAGVLVAEYSYDPWGRQRNPETLEIYDSGDELYLFLGRGFTGHEHLDWCGLINMNARLYDPTYGRFLNPDPFINTPSFTQSFNRYSYALNNPLKYTDETGEFITWSVSGSGIQIGLNFGYWGFGLIFNWSDPSIGVYTEVGARFLGKIFGFGIAMEATSQLTIDYNFAKNQWNASVSASISASLGAFTVSLRASYSAINLTGETQRYITVSGSADISITPLVGINSSYDNKINIQNGESEQTFTAGINTKLTGFPGDSYVKGGAVAEWKNDGDGFEFSKAFFGVSAGSTGGYPYKKTNKPNLSDYLPYMKKGWQPMKKSVGNLSEVNLAKIEYFNWEALKKFILGKDDETNSDKK